MPRFKVRCADSYYYDVTVDAEDEDGAFQKALDLSDENFTKMVVNDRPLPPGVEFVEGEWDVTEVEAEEQ